MNAPAGWYADPERPSQLRYWDGERWTDYTHPGYQHAGAAADAQRPGWYRPLGDWLGTSFSDVGSSLGSLAAISGAGFVVPSLVLSWLLSWALDGVIVINDDIQGLDSGRIVAAAVGVIGSLFASVIGANALAAHLSAARLGRRLSFSESYALGTRCLPRLIGWYVALLGITLGAVVVVAMGVVLNPGVGFLLALAGFLAGVWALVRVAPLLIAVVSAPHGTSSLRAALDVTASRWWSTFGRLLLLTLIAGLCAAVPAAVLQQIAFVFSDAAEPVFGENGDDPVVIFWELGPTLAPGGWALPFSALATAVQQAISLSLSLAGLAGLYHDTRGPIRTEIAPEEA